MATVGFGVCLTISIFVVGFMAFKNYENINTYYWTLVVLIPIVILGYFLKTMITTPEAAVICFCFIYLDSTVLLTVMIFSMLQAIGVTVKPWVKVLGYAAAFGHMGIIWGSTNTDLYYKSVEVIETSVGNATKMVSGPLKIVHVIYLGIIVLAIVGIIIAGYVRKGTYSRRTLTFYTVICVVGMAMYAVEAIIDINFSVLPYLYVVADLVIAIDYDHEHAHDISCLISEQQKYHGNKAYIAFDFKKKFLSCNQKAYDFLPELLTQRVDVKLPKESNLCSIFYDMIDDYRENGIITKKFKAGDVTYVCEISTFSIRRDGKAQGYIFDIRDATEEQ